MVTRRRSRFAILKQRPTGLFFFSILFDLSIDDKQTDVRIRTYKKQNSHKGETMTLENATGSKKVNIKKDNCGQFGAFYVQSDGMGGEQVLACKCYATEKAAIKWAKKQLG